jgi:hypothetical protein
MPAAFGGRAAAGGRQSGKAVGIASEAGLPLYAAMSCSQALQGRSDWLLIAAAMIPTVRAPAAAAGCRQPLPPHLVKGKRLLSLGGAPDLHYRHQLAVGAGGWLYTPLGGATTHSLTVTCPSRPSTTTACCRPSRRSWSLRGRQRTNTCGARGRQKGASAGSR